MNSDLYWTLKDTDFNMFFDTKPQVKSNWFFNKKFPNILNARISWLRTGDSAAQSIISWLHTNNIPVHKITHEFISWELTVEQMTALKLTFS